MAANHRTTIVGSKTTCQARCSCRQRSLITDRSGAEDWVFHHQRDVEIAKAALHRNPTLRTQRDWFVKQSENIDNEYDDRVLWRQLAEEIDRFVNKRESSVDQLPLW